MTYDVKNWENRVLFSGSKSEAIEWCKKNGDPSCEVYLRSRKRNLEPVYGNWNML